MTHGFRTHRRPACCAVWAILAAASWFGLNAAASAQQFSIGAYHLQSSTRVSLTQYDYAYTADVHAAGAAAASLIGNVVSSSPNTLIRKGSVDFGAVPANGSATSADTFVLRQDRRFAFSPQALTWSFSFAGSVTLSATSFDFGQNLTGSSLIKAVTTVTNTGGGAVTLQPALAGDASFTPVPGGCAGMLAPGASCDVKVEYLPVNITTQSQTAVLNLGIPGLPSGTIQTVALTGTSAALEPGQVAPSANRMVAQYTLTLPFAGTWWVRFGPTTAYGRSTSVVKVPVGGTPTSLYVAGMLPNTQYHMQASVALANGVTSTDVDHTFTVGALPAGVPATLPVTLSPGKIPQPGIELIDTLVGAIPTTALATDLQGNVIWAYQFPDRTPTVDIYPVTPLPNGHFLSIIAPVYPNAANPGVLNVLREFDLAGNTVQQLTMADLNQRMIAYGFPITLNVFSHDIILLPTGHYLVIANAIKPYTDLPGYPGTTQVGGDIVVDLDPTLQPQWVWSSFDHLDINRHPFQFPDWTHANSVAYSKDDGNFIISLRHQNWILKIDYANGTGTGNVIWHLGQDGDFTLQGAINPTDWFYAQHAAEFTTPNTTGVFSMELFDNGDDRIFPPGYVCGSGAGQTPCLYSTAAEMRIDENAKTASYIFHQILPPNLYSASAGNNEKLANGDYHYNLAGVGNNAFAFEVTPGATIDDPAEPVWELQLPGTNTYRTLRLPSLYPGVQW